MRVGFFGGTFDPPHRGHLRVAQAAAERFRLHRVLLAPVAQQPLKPDGSTAPYADRLAMTSLLCGVDPSARLEASGLDAERPDGAPNYTVDTLRRLRAMLTAEDSLFAITGADSFLDLRRWRAPETLLTLAEWIVVSRPGLEAEQLDRLELTTGQRARVHWLGRVAETVSATEVRARLAAGADCREMVPDPVLAFIQEHGLYGAGRDAAAGTERRTARSLR